MKRIGLFYGGLSNESEVSVLSAVNIEKYLDKDTYHLYPFFRDKNGKFYHCDAVEKLEDKKELSFEQIAKMIDIALPITHGKYGEDGVLQAFFEAYKIPYCGCNVLSSAICMDKGLCKILCQGQGIDQLPFAILGKDYLKNKKIVQSFLEQYQAPLYIKPANSGSSIGISKISSLEDFELAYQEALQYDSKIIIEKGLTQLQEVEVGIVGNQELLISEPGELVLTKDFYDYQDKYYKGETKIQIPANLSFEQKTQIKAYAEKIYKLCHCRGFARIDFFVAGGQIFFNEINTLPGFTDASMFPLLMENVGLSYKQLLSKIIDLAQE